MSKSLALMKREFIDSKSGIFLTPMFLSAFMLLMVVIAALGFANVEIDGHRYDAEVHNLGSFLEMVQSKVEAEGKEGDVPSVVALAYWMISMPLVIALPFFIFFSLVYAMYEERKDKSILFWKSMPVSDWQEVGARFINSVFVGLLTYLGFIIALQVISAVFLSSVSLVQGGPVAMLWPLGTMIATWFSALFMMALHMLWAAPLLAWLIFVSSVTTRLPILFSTLPVILIMVVEGMFFDSSNFGEWIAIHLGGWQGKIDGFENTVVVRPEDIAAYITSDHLINSLSATFASPSFYLGLVLAGGFFYATVNARKNSI